MRLRIESVRYPPIYAALHAACFPQPWEEASFARLFSLETTFGIVAVAPEPAGFAVVQAAADEAELLVMGVTPERRREGIGAALLERACLIAQLQGAAALYLEVRFDNLAAQALYSGAGFAEAGRRPGYYEDAQGRHDAIVMRKALTIS